MILIKDLSKSFTINKKQKKELNTDKNEVLAVNNISFNCEPGSVFSLLGPNGAGKTTTLRMIAGIFKPSAGQIEINGIDAVKYPLEAKKHIGFLTGSAGLYARLTPNELLKYFADLYQVNADDFDKRKKHLYDLLEMNHFQNKKIGQLSTGMTQKVAIARTMIHDPKVIIFDEPTSGLDVIAAEHIIELIKNCKNEGKTVIFSSHIMSEVDYLCDDLAIIDQGNLLYKGYFIDFKNNFETENLTSEFIHLVKKNRA
jgi:sodium transport system ATP-binding protein